MAVPMVLIQEKNISQSLNYFITEIINESKMKNLKYILFVVLLPILFVEVHGQKGFEHRGYSGWKRDLSRTACNDAWPSIRIDSALLSDYEESLDFLQRAGMNEITLWGLFTNKYWEPEVEKTIDTQRKELVKLIIAKAHQRKLKIINGMGIYSWGFDKILKQKPELGCPCNRHVMDLSNPESWEWQKKVIDYTMDNFDFDGVSMQSADLGRCKCGQSQQLSDMEYHAIINQKAVSYIRSKNPNYIIGIAGWGMNFGNPSDLKYIRQMTQNVDYLIDVGESVLTAGREYRQKLIKAIAPCRYGNTSVPNIEPIQAMPRDLYFIPTIYHTCQRLKDIFNDGGMACDAYARTRGNPGDKVTIEVVTKIISNPETDITAALKETLEVIYKPVNKNVLSELVSIYREAEDAFFSNYPGSDKELIEVMPRGQMTPESGYFKIMEPSSKVAYINAMNRLYERTSGLRGKVENYHELEFLIQCFNNILSQINMSK
jgi:hypothetical protein